MLDSTPVGLGAGPGRTKTYRVDLPFPWGDDTELTLPVQQLSQDFADAAWPTLYARISHALPQLYDSNVKPELDRSVEQVKAISVKLMWGTALLGAATLFGYALLRRRR